MTNDKAARGRPGYSREQVIRVAVSEFNRRGYEATSIGKLAERLGVTKSAVYHHIDSKEQILVEATSAALGRLEEVLAAAEGAARPIAEVVRGAVLVLCELPGEVTLLLRLRGNTEVERGIMERRRGITRRVIALIAQGQRVGEVRADIDPGVAGRLALGAINSITEWYRPDGELSPEQLADAAVNLVFGGLTRDVRNTEAPV